MRLRNIPEAKGVIENSPYVIHDGKLTFEKNDAPLEIEIGTGKGSFLIETAKRHPEINYLGVERYESVLFRACEKLAEDEDPPHNIRFFCLDARELPQFLEKDSVSVLYLNFSDPWPKKKHAKRRLTSSAYLKLYEGFLKDGGTLEFKTDNRGLFAFSEEQLEEADRWEITARTEDLHRDPVLGNDNIMTEYERKFSALGNRICKLKAVYHAAR